MQRPCSKDVLRRQRRVLAGGHALPHVVALTCVLLAWPTAGDLPSTSREFALLMQEVLTEQRWAKHRAAILSTPSLQHSVARVVLNHCLPHVAGYVAAGIQKGAPLLPSSSTLLAVSAVLASGVAGSPGSSQLGAAGAAAAVHHAARAVQALPTQRSGEPACTFSDVHFSAASLLAFSCERITLGAATAALSASGSSGGSRAAGGRASADAVADAFMAEARAAGWVVAGAMPRLEAALRSLAAEAEDPAAFSPQGPSQQVSGHALLDVDHYCKLLSDAFVLPSGRQHQQASATQLAVWAAAMAAAARLLPLLARLSGRLRQLDHEPAGVQSLAGVALQFVAAGLPGCPSLEPGSTAATEPHDSPARRNAAEAFLQLHCTMARLLNWLAAEGQSCSLWEPDGLADRWLPLLSSFGRVWYAAHMVRCRRILPPNRWPQLGEVPE